MDVAILIRDLEPFRRARPVWDRAAEMIMLAAETGKQGDVAEANAADTSGAWPRELDEVLSNVLIPMDPEKWIDGPAKRGVKVLRDPLAVAFRQHAAEIARRPDLLINSPLFPCRL